MSAARSIYAACMLPQPPCLRSPPSSPSPPAPCARAGTAQLSFTKEAAALPQVALLGGSEQTFAISAGIRVQTSIELGTVCPGARWRGWGSEGAECRGGLLRVQEARLPLVQGWSVDGRAVDPLPLLHAPHAPSHTQASA